MTQGGPNDATQVLVRCIYQTGFRDSELGRAGAMEVFLFLIMGTFSVIQFIVAREKKLTNRGYYWLVTLLAIPAFVWLVPTLWMVSLSFQTNEVLARTTSTTAFGLILPPFTTENYSTLTSFVRHLGGF